MTRTWQLPPCHEQSVRYSTDSAPLRAPSVTILLPLALSLYPETLVAARPRGPPLPSVWAGPRRARRATPGRGRAKRAAGVRVKTRLANAFASPSHSPPRLFSGTLRSVPFPSRLSYHPHTIPRREKKADRVGPPFAALVPSSAPRRRAGPFSLAAGNSWDRSPCLRALDGTTRNGSAGKFTDTNVNKVGREDSRGLFVFNGY